MTKSARQILFSLMLFAAMAGQLRAQGTVFTYQGQLIDGGAPANGTNYGMAFYVYDAATNGTLLGNLGLPSVTVSNGLFMTPLDFGNVFNGSPRWLQITVQKNGGGFTTLWPREPLTATPYAIMAGSASNVVGVVPGSQLVTNFANGLNLNGSFGGVFNGTITGGTLVNASVNYPYKSFYTNYTITTNDAVLNCTGTNQVITLLPASNFPPSALLTIWSDNVNGSVTITNGTGSEAITVPGQGQALAVLLGPANSPSNSVTLMIHGGHW